jgi:hypothetical protein
VKIKSLFDWFSREKEASMQQRAEQSPAGQRVQDREDDEQTTQQLTDIFNQTHNNLDTAKFKLDSVLHDLQEKKKNV